MPELQRIHNAVAESAGDAGDDNAGDVRGDWDGRDDAVCQVGVENAAAQAGGFFFVQPVSLGRLRSCFQPGVIGSVVGVPGRLRPAQGNTPGRLLLGFGGGLRSFFLLTGSAAGVLDRPLDGEPLFGREAVENRVGDELAADVVDSGNVDATRWGVNDGKGKTSGEPMNLFTVILPCCPTSRNWVPMDLINLNNIGLSGIFFRPCHF